MIVLEPGLVIHKIYNGSVDDIETEYRLYTPKKFHRRGRRRDELLHRKMSRRAKDNERPAAGQRAEQQRHLDFLALLTKEQEERENREARECFAASQRKKWGE